MIERIKKFKEINKEYLIWLTGFFEGEGSCGYYSKSNDLIGNLVLRISQKEREVFDEMVKVIGFGSIVCSRKNTPIEGYFYSVHNKLAVYLLSLMLPFIRTTRKRNQILKALKDYENRKNVPARLKRIHNSRSKVAKIKMRNENGQFIKPLISI